MQQRYENYTGCTSMPTHDYDISGPYFELSEYKFAYIENNE